MKIEETREREEIVASENMENQFEIDAEEAVTEQHESQNDVCENMSDISVQKVKSEVATETGKNGQAEITTIIATAVISNSNSSQVTTANIGDLSYILKSKDHLCRNISYLNFQNFRTFRLNNGNYEHSVQIEIGVRTGNLWESARSYIFHHLGRDTWTLNDGARISMIRIHQRRCFLVFAVCLVFLGVLPFLDLCFFLYCTNLDHLIVSEKNNIYIYLTRHVYQKDASSMPFL